jgi:hypothetical protein
VRSGSPGPPPTSEALHEVAAFGHLRLEDHDADFRIVLQAFDERGDLTDGPLIPSRHGLVFQLSDTLGA